MELFEKKDETIASSRIYLICKQEKKGLFRKCFSKPQVLYVGETFDKKNRFSPHEKLLKATTLKKSNEVLVVYFLHMRFQFVGFNNFENNPLDIFNEIKDIHSKTAIKLMERFFIKLFRPILNEQHNNNDVLKDKLIHSMLIQKSIDIVSLDIGMNDYEFNFMGGHRKEDEDWYSFNLITNELTTGHPILK